MFKYSCILPVYKKSGYVDHDTALLNIETTGLSFRNSFICMAGIAYLSEDGSEIDGICRPENSENNSPGAFIKCRILIASSRRDERTILNELVRAAGGFKKIISYGGNGFIYNFIKERFRLYSDDSFFKDDQITIDILDSIRPYRDILPMDGLSKYTVEKAAGFKRDFQISGKELVQIYQKWENTASDDLRSLLRSHLCDDLRSVYCLSAFLSFRDFFTGRSINNIRSFTKDGSMTAVLYNEYSFPISFSYSSKWAEIKFSENSVMIRTPIFKGRLKYFLPGNSSDYYYLPEEDIAVHKSVGKFVDKSHRIKADKETCFTAAEGIFLPSPKIKKVMLFRSDYHSDKHYILYDPENKELLLTYLLSIIRNK